MKQNIIENIIISMLKSQIIPYKERINYKRLKNYSWGFVCQKCGSKDDDGMYPMTHPLEVYLKIDLYHKDKNGNYKIKEKYKSLDNKHFCEYCYTKEKNSIRDKIENVLKVINETKHN